MFFYCSFNSIKNEETIKLNNIFHIKISFVAICVKIIKSILLIPHLNVNIKIYLNFRKINECMLLP
jgi:hypothetical protein